MCEPLCLKNFWLKSAYPTRIFKKKGLCKKGFKGVGLAKGLMAPKAIKAASAMKVLKLNLKRPAAAEAMSLDDKMELFQKRGSKDVQQFLDGLTKGQREALWQRFANTRASLKDPETEGMWQEVAKGKGSDPAKKQLLQCFLKLGGDLKGKKDQWQKELISYTKSSGHLAVLLLHKQEQ